MGRRKNKQPSQLLTHPILFRVSQAEFERLQAYCRESDCPSIGEALRRLLQGKPITLFHRDRSLEAPLEELARIRQELRAIGVNINQLLRYFHSTPRSAERQLLADQALGQYRQVEAKVSLLLSLISKLSAKW